MTGAESSRAYRRRHPERVRASSKRWRDANQEKVAEVQRLSRARRAAQIREYEKTPTERARRAANKRRLRATDPAWAERERARHRAMRASLDPAEKARRAENVARWRRENRDRTRNHNRVRRLRQLGSPGADYCTAAKIEARRLLYGGHCFYCGAPDATSMDHRIPVARGGTEFPSNLVPACGSCNSRKGTRTESEWRLAA